MIFRVNVLHKEWVEKRAFFLGGPFEFRMCLEATRPRIGYFYEGTWRREYNIHHWELEHIGYGTEAKRLFDLGMEPFIEYLRARAEIESSFALDEEEVLRAVISPAGQTFSEFMEANKLPIYTSDGMRRKGSFVHRQPLMD